jgi:hypothetical protein
MPSDAEVAERVTQSNAWAALSMIRETVETLGPPGILPARTTLGPEPVHEAEAIVAALQKMFGAERHRG